MRAAFPKAARASFSWLVGFLTADTALLLRHVLYPAAICSRKTPAAQIFAFFAKCGLHPKAKGNREGIVYFRKRK
ncbi:MAG: hypothetical protein DBY30_07675 [Verrucomicrobia bacterium]|nr:MAG: hypothetical protein DBY30_07675 [Verrucomicrobiota bacterium]